MFRDPLIPSFPALKYGAVAVLAVSSIEIPCSSGLSAGLSEKLELT